MRKAKSRGDSVLLTTGIFAIAVVISTIVHYASFATANIQTTEVRRQITDIMYKEARVVDREYGHTFSLPPEIDDWKITYEIKTAQVCATATKENLTTRFCIYRGKIGPPV